MLTMATIPIGMSCSVRGKLAPAPEPRTRDARNAEARPPQIGPMSFKSVTRRRPRSRRRDEAHAVAEDVGNNLVEGERTGGVLHRFAHEVRNEEEPRDGEADGHGDADRNADEVADAEEGEGKARVEGAVALLAKRKKRIVSAAKTPIVARIA